MKTSTSKNSSRWGDRATSAYVLHFATVAKEFQNAENTCLLCNGDYRNRTIAAILLDRRSNIRHHQADPSYHGLCHKCVLVDADEWRVLAMDRCSTELASIHRYMKNPTDDASDEIQSAEMVARWLEAPQSCAIDIRNLDEYISEHYAAITSSIGKVIRKAILEGCDGESGAV